MNKIKYTKKKSGSIEINQRYNFLREKKTSDSIDKLIQPLNISDNDLTLFINKLKQNINKQDINKINAITINKQLKNIINNKLIELYDEIQIIYNETINIKGPFKLSNFNFILSNLLIKALQLQYITDTICNNLEIKFTYNILNAMKLKNKNGMYDIGSINIDAFFEFIKKSKLLIIEPNNDFFPYLYACNVPSNNISNFQDMEIKNWFSKPIFSKNNISTSNKCKPMNKIINKNLIQNFEISIQMIQFYNDFIRTLVFVLFGVYFYCSIDRFENYNKLQRLKEFLIKQTANNETNLIKQTTKAIKTYDIINDEINQTKAILNLLKELKYNIKFHDYNSYNAYAPQGLDSRAILNTIDSIRKYKKLMINIPKYTAVGIGFIITLPLTIILLMWLSDRPGYSGVSIKKSDYQAPMQLAYNPPNPPYSSKPKSNNLPK